jgi:hypothetical protein
MNLAVLHMADHMTSETGTWGRMLHGDKDAFVGALGPWPTLLTCTAEV